MTGPVRITGQCAVCGHQVSAVSADALLAAASAHVAYSTGCASA